MASWQTTRSQILERDNHTCQRCSSVEQLEVHHKTPRIEGGTDEFDNLITLCYGCHNYLHHKDSIDFSEAVKRVKEEYRQAGGDFGDSKAWTDFQHNWDGWPEQ